MATEEALKDLTFKMAHYKAQYESPTLGSLWELPCPMVKLLDGGEGGVIAHGVTGVREGKILAYISTPKPYQQTLYFSRVSFNIVSLTSCVEKFVVIFNSINSEKCDIKFRRSTSVSNDFYGTQN